MTIQQNTRRIQTTHIGSLPRPHALLDVLKRKYAGETIDTAAFEKTLRQSVVDCVAKQVACGIDIVTDGEFSKPGFFTYVQERLEGFEARPAKRMTVFQKEIAAFPEYYAEYFKTAMMGGAIVPLAPVVCIAPVKYRGEEAVRRDIDNVKAGAKAAGVPDHQVFLPATSPSGVGVNEYYKSDEDYFHALAAELGKEYRAIVDSGILVQIDDPFLSDIFVEPDLDAAGMRRRAQMYVEAVNAALKGIPEERVRFHTCYGINEGPRIHEAALADVIDHMFKIAAGSFSFEAANPRHEHEYHLVRKHQGSGRKGHLSRRDHTREQYRRASGTNCRAYPALCKTGRPGKRDRRRGLRVLLAGALQDGSASHDCLGKIQGPAAGSGYCHEEALDLNHERTFPLVRPLSALPRKSDVARHDPEIRQGPKAAAHVYGALPPSMEKSRPALLPPPPIAITQ